MIKKTSSFFMLLMLTLELNYASDRVVVESLPSDIWYKRIYLIADKKTGWIMKISPFKLATEVN